MPNVIIRPYRNEDRPYVRALCCDTADMGEPVERLFPDREVAADLLTAYYTDYEPSSIIVAQIEGQLVGYALGALDNRRYGLVMNWILLPKITVKAFKRGLFFDQRILSLLGGLLRNWRRLVVWRKESFHSHQAHMHIGVAKGARGQGIGHRLMDALLAYAATQHVGEITASVHGENASGNKFFQRMGFKVKEQYPMVVARDGGLSKYTSFLYAKTIT